MEAHEYYKKETGKLYYKEAALELELTDDYINWLERNVVKLFAIPAVVGQSEQLKAFLRWAENEWMETPPERQWEQMFDEYFKSL